DLASEAAFAFQEADAKANQDPALQYKARYWLGVAMVESKHPKQALKVLRRLVSQATPPDPKIAEAWKAWRSLALLEEGEAHEHLRQWATARALYETMTRDRWVSDRDKDEAKARLAFIRQNVPPTALEGSSHD
ncbi:MAG: hypothetical protein KGR26_12735, partial [Cyanobacteria bacterium REEB65]|nr:hypothetical protein [Cyanobacteria bacterium REEB65]